jgi:anti-sigma-K factor RskA
MEASVSEDQDLAAKLTAMEKRLADLTAVMTRLDKALTEPHPGYGNRGLLEWMAASAVESHARAAAGETLIRVAKYVTAIGVVVSGTIAAMKFGGSPK